MQTPFSARQTAQSSWGKNTKTKVQASAGVEWRCSSCGKLLGVSRDDCMHLRFARGHEYFVAFPVVATCRGCGALNQAQTPPR